MLFGEASRVLVLEIRGLDKVNEPKMIIFDYGQTLVDEKPFDGLKGTEAVLREATNNPNNVSIEEIQTLANELNSEIGRFGSDFEKQPFLEVHNHIFQNYLYVWYKGAIERSNKHVPTSDYLEVNDWNELIEIL